MSAFNVGLLVDGLSVERVELVMQAGWVGTQLQANRSECVEGAQPLLVDAEEPAIRGRSFSQLCSSARLAMLHSDDLEHNAASEFFGAAFCVCEVFVVRCFRIC